ncbi:EF-hand domain-containing protein [Mesorhizobium xinjiangense]|uniref:EF-hand domain-containing protein n=1 Tax=Mesorhizobium xinjiangense TaxID=2678685 RepID=UPI0012ED90B5|nr:EF-hand domain-containing protein [Mesorhizobium xinjiangense]
MHKIILAAAITFVAGTGLAAAQQAPAMHEGHLDRLDANNNGGVSQQEYEAFMVESFARLDKNGDGVLIESEVTEVLTPEQFRTTDKNGDGRVSRDEFRRQVMSDFAAADRDGDGHLK